MDLARFKRLLNRNESRFWAHWFTADEARFCTTSASPAEAAAQLFAVKEATFKALGGRFPDPLMWRDIEVLGDGQAKHIRLHGEFQIVADDLRLDRFHLSICCREGRAIAAVIIEGDAPA